MGKGIRALHIAVYLIGKAQMTYMALKQARNYKVGKVAIIKVVKSSAFRWKSTNRKVLSLKMDLGITAPGIFPKTDRLGHLLQRLHTQGITDIMDAIILKKFLQSLAGHIWISVRQHQPDTLYMAVKLIDEFVKADIPRWSH